MNSNQSTPQQLPDEQSILEIKSLVEKAKETGNAAIINSGNRIAVCAKIGGLLTEIKRQLGKAYDQWREDNLPEVAAIEKGCCKLAREKQRHPDLFLDSANLVKYGRWAGVLPMPESKGKGEPKPAEEVALMKLEALVKALGSVDMESWLNRVTVMAQMRALMFLLSKVDDRKKLDLGIAA